MWLNRRSGVQQGRLVAKPFLAYMKQPRPFRRVNHLSILCTNDHLHYMFLIVAGTPKRPFCNFSKARQENLSELHYQALHSVGAHPAACFPDYTQRESDYQCLDVAGARYKICRSNQEHAVIDLSRRLASGLGTHS